MIVKAQRKWQKPKENLKHNVLTISKGNIKHNRMAITTRTFKAQQDCNKEKQVLNTIEWQ